MDISMNEWMNERMRFMNGKTDQRGGSSPNLTVRCRFFTFRLCLTSLPLWAELILRPPLRHFTPIFRSESPASIIPPFWIQLHFSKEWMAATFDGLEKSENLFENTKAVEAASAAFSTTTLSTQMKTCRYLCHILCAMGPPPAPPSVPFTFHRMQTLSLTHSLSLCVSFPTNLLSRYSQEEREMREEDAGGGGGGW